ncbi:DUF397 domain-containing protein [Micromonospora sp. NPDC050187]|uniref:DUF397 domain-containing protein n=1 Tax=Micromonospora sp. NPDC050187 TaxID=3364277 RepID=UPI0037BD934C
MEEAGTARVTWWKSTRSNGSGNCVEVGKGLPDGIGLRDSKDRSGPALLFTPRNWTAFVNGLKTGDFITG